MRAFFAFFILLLPFAATAAQTELARDAAKEVVIDPARQLMWQDNKMPLQGSSFAWQAADAYCKNLVFAGFSDWRLPAKDELLSIVDLSREPGYAKANQAFRHVFSSYHWSGSKVPPQDDPWKGKGKHAYAWTVHFDSGLANMYSMGYEVKVKCVRTLERAED